MFKITAQWLTCYSGNDVAESDPALLDALDHGERVCDQRLQDVDPVGETLSGENFGATRDGDVFGVGALVVMVPKTPIL